MEGGGIGRGGDGARILEFIEACRKGFWGDFGGAACYNCVVGRQSGAARYYRSFQMIINSFRVLVDTDGKRYRFDRFAFNEALGAAKRTAKERDQMLSREFFQAFADALATSVSTITHWASRYNGPSDMGRVKDMAEFLGIDYKDLLLSEEQEDAMNENMDMMKETMEAGMAESATVESVTEHEVLKSLFLKASDLIAEYLSWLEDYLEDGWMFSISVRPQNEGEDSLRERLKYDKSLHAFMNKIEDLLRDIRTLKYDINFNTLK